MAFAGGDFLEVGTDTSVFVPSAVATFVWIVLSAILKGFIPIFEATIATHGARGHLVLWKCTGIRQW